jgi:altronate dehydratase
MKIAFDAVARLPISNDNIAIATRRLPAGTEINYGETVIRLSHTVLLGHRFAVQPVAVGEKLLSWGQVFGTATRSIAAGDYVINADVLEELSRRSLDIDLPSEANFQNDLARYQFDEAAFQPAPPLPRYAETKTFMGYDREAGRGVGTRNIIVLLGTSSLVSGFVRQLENRLKDRAATYTNVEDIVAVAHTEGGHGKPNNQELLLRTLAGFIVHPNVAAVLIVDYGSETINNLLLKDYLLEHNYPLSGVLHQFISLTHSFSDDLIAAEQVVLGWLDTVNQMERSPQPLSALKIALQCGGSDAFSGISGNPLAAWVAKEVIQYGGVANLAETDELIGAETYVLAKARNAATAKKFLSVMERFKERVAWHGQSADGNPSGGNKFRGLYNIYLKSLGAATKRHPDVPLDYVIDYGERMRDPGFYFMDSPGNDLESIAGQIASGCNVIFFITGNGSITNFPFVPTIKMVTTTERYQLLKEDMDINAGAYLDGTPLEELGAETLDYTIAIASGQRSAGEQAGHAQVQIWRDWQLTAPAALEPLQSRRFSGQPIPLQGTGEHVQVVFSAYRNAKYYTGEQLGLILPTSLCSGQIARLCVQALNKHIHLKQPPVSRFVTLVHTEGCGSSLNDEFRDTLLGYLGHPAVKHALLLEHGCEATHNDYFRHAMRARGYDPQKYGWASIQLDGGIQNVVQKMIAWFDDQIARDPLPEKETVGLEALRVALITRGPCSAQVADTLARLTRQIVGAGGTVVVHEQDNLLRPAYAAHLVLEDRLAPTLGYAQVAEQPGFHLMGMPTLDWAETLTGLGAAGVNVILGVVDDRPMPGHPMLPVLQVSEHPHSETDLLLSSDTLADTNALLKALIATFTGEYVPKVVQSGNLNFQVTRGLLGVSL